jgi:hypothetical protein
MEIPAPAARALARDLMSLSSAVFAAPPGIVLTKQPRSRRSLPKVFMARTAVERAFVRMAGVEDRRLSGSELEVLRRSWARHRQLSPEDTDRVLGECEELLREREGVVATLDKLSAGPWLELRRLMADLEALAKEREG